jgi:hypothetical protein
MDNFLSKINWNNVSNEILEKTGEVRTIGEKFYENKDGKFDKIKILWKQAGYTANKVEWINYYPGNHFDKKVEENFAKEVNLNPVRSWISCIRPGKSAPWHQDIDDNMDEYIKLGNLIRYTCHIGKPAHGQVLTIETECFYMTPQGTITKWNDWLDWHGSSNCGFENHYLYHFLGYK